MNDPQLTEPVLRVGREPDGVVCLTLNRPAQRNALSEALLQALRSTLAELAADPAVRVLVMNSLTALCITKLDVLDELDAIRIAVGYRVDGEPMDSLPIGAEAVADCQPIYEEMPGWRASTLGLRSLDELPGAARDYLRRIEEIVGVPVDMISTGPDRNHTIVLRNPLD